MALTYPAGGLLEGTGSDFVSFGHFEYSSNRSRGGATPPSAGNIRLYMPASTPPISNANGWSSVNFPGPMGEITLDVIQEGGAMLGDIGDQINNGSIKPGKIGGDTIDGLKRIFNNAKNNAGGLTNQLGANFAGQMLNISPNHITALSQGKIFNPNTELLYDGPQLRAFNFAFNFMPRNAGEARIVDNIILEFKKWSAPSESGSQGMFKVPHIWSVAYSNGGKMNAFKPSALMNVAVQANPNTPNHVTFTDKTPVETSISLAFQEVELITREDHESVGGQGY